MLQEPDDGLLLQQARDGNRKAFGLLVDRHKDALVNYMTGLTGRHDRAEDLAQEAFLRLYNAAPHYQERGQMKAYLFRIATNLLRSEERREGRWRRIRTLFWNRNGHGEVDNDPGQERRLLQEELGDKLRRAIASLPLRYRTPLVLHELAGWPYQRISAVLECQEGTVKSRIHRGRKLLREKLAPYWTGADS